MNYCRVKNKKAVIHLKFKDGRGSRYAPIIDNRLRESISLATTAEVPEEICVLMSKSFKAIADQLEEDNLLKDIMEVQILVTDRDEITLELFEEELATVISIIIYPIIKWTEARFNDEIMLMFIIEEFAHFYWNIRDEVQVNYKVLEIIQRIIPTLKMEDIYSIDFMEENK